MSYMYIELTFALIVKLLAGQIVSHRNRLTDILNMIRDHGHGL